MLSKTLGKSSTSDNGALPMEEEEHETEESTANEKRTSEKIVPNHKRKSSNQKVINTKENRRPASRTSVARGRTTALSGTTRTATSTTSSRPKSNLTTPAPSKKIARSKIFMEDDDLEDEHYSEEEEEDGRDDDSDWDGEEEEDSEMSAADEASSSNQQQRRRTSSRLREKKERRDSELPTTQQREDDDDDNSSVSSRRSTRSRSSIGSHQSNIPRPRRQSTGTATSTARSTRRSSLTSRNSNNSSGDDSASSGQRNRTSSLPQPRTRIHNPGASKRTGKQLSSIPSDSIAPMSPLVALPKSRMDEDIKKQQERAKARTSRPRASSVDRGGQSGSDSDTSTSRRRKTASNSDSETVSRRASSGRKSLGSVSSSNRSSVGSGRSRRSLGGIGSNKRPDMSSQQKPQSLRDLRTIKSSDSEERQGRHSLPAATSSSSGRPRESDLPSKGAVFVHGMPVDNSWASQVSHLRDENNAEHELFAGHTLCTGDEEMRIRVIVRKRPMSSSEAAGEKEIDVIHPLEYDSYGRVLVYQPKTRVDLTKEVETVPFAFDNVFDERSNNARIYNRAVRNLIPGVFEGRWASVFAYGQTGSGKTYTMMGSNLTGINAGNATLDEQNLGLYYMAAMDVFEMANDPAYRHLSVGASLFEIYGGKLFDLLNERKPVKCLENHRGKVCFPGLSEHPVESARALMAIIEAGALNRSTGTTSKNADSSRSHAVLQLSLRKDVRKEKNVEHGRLTFIDLAGSERGADTSKASRTTRLEGAEINTSLLALKEVIRALATGDSMAHIPFRGSKLTQVLKESFVGVNNSSVMVACIAPNMSNCEHTLNTLRYADRVKERDPESGRLPEGVAHRKRDPSRRLSRSTSAPVGMTSSKPLVALSDSGDEEAAQLDHNSGHGGREYASFQEDMLHEEDEQSSDSALLDDLLDSDPSPPSHSESHAVYDESSSDAVQTNSKGNKAARRAAADALIKTHRSVMTDLLEMVKHEMALVNKADGDRDTIDSYLDELEGIQEKQDSLLDKLREKLDEYKKARGGMPASDMSPSKATEDVLEELLSEDSSFEDLRD